LPSAVRSPRPIVWTNSMRLLVGLATLIQRTSRSTPVVSTPTLQMMRVSPDRNRLKVASRSSRVVTPSMYSAATPASRKRSATCPACFRLTQKTDGRPTLAALEPSFDNVAGDNSPIHSFGKFAFMEIARYSADVR
jgi:hypothetical protein